MNEEKRERVGYVMVELFKGGGTKESFDYSGVSVAELQSMAGALHVVLYQLSKHLAETFIAGHAQKEKEETP